MSPTIAPHGQPNWDATLNAFLDVGHNADGSLKQSAVQSALGGYSSSFAPEPDLHGLLGWTFDPANCSNVNALTPTSGTRYFFKVPWKVTKSVTSIVAYIGTAGVTLTAGQSALGIVSSAGVLLASTGDLSAAFVSAGAVVAPLAGGPVSIPADASGFVWVELITVGTTTPKFAGISVVGVAALTNVNLVAATARVGTGATAQTALGATVPTTISSVPTWFGLA